MEGGARKKEGKKMICSSCGAKSEVTRIINVLDGMVISGKCTVCGYRERRIYKRLRWKKKEPTDKEPTDKQIEDLQKGGY